MYKNILVATDGSKLSDKAVAAAIKMAALCKAKLTAVHVTEPYPMRMFSEYAMIADYPTPKSWRGGQLKRADRILERAKVAAAKAKVKINVTTAEATEPWEAILATARKNRNDLIVMASHGRRGLEGLLLGSETHKVLTHGKVPVLVCR